MCQRILHEKAKTFLAEQCKVDEDGNKLKQVIGEVNGSPLHRWFLKDGTFVDEEGNKIEIPEGYTFIPAQ